MADRSMWLGVRCLCGKGSLVIGLRSLVNSQACSGSAAGGATTGSHHTHIYMCVYIHTHQQDMQRCSGIHCCQPVLHPRVLVVRSPALNVWQLSRNIPTGDRSTQQVAGSQPQATVCNLCCTCQQGFSGHPPSHGQHSLVHVAFRAALPCPPHLYGLSVVDVAVCCDHRVLHHILGDGARKHGVNL